MLTTSLLTTHKKTLVAMGIFLLVSAAVILLTYSLIQNQTVLAAVASLGYAGVFSIAIAAGLNSILPVPAATLTPVFLEAGLTMFGIIFFLALGTLVADSIGFFFGKLGHNYLKDTHTKVVTYFTTLLGHHRLLVLPTIALYVAFVPLPNELIMIPLGFSGYRFSLLVLPLLVGNLVNQTVLAFGITSLFTFF